MATMHQLNLPLEVTSLILRHLIEPVGGGYKYPDIEQNFCHLQNARLVCRQWNQLAMAHLFDTVVLKHSMGEAAADFGNWSKIIDSEAIRPLVRDAVIHSAPEQLNMRDVEEWEEWEEEGKYDAFTNSINRISELRNLKSLQLSFSGHCAGVNNVDEYNDDVESIATRRLTLETVFNAIVRRVRKDKDVRPIQSLTIENLQNVPIPDFVESEMFREAIKTVSHLGLMIQEEVNEHGPDHDIYCLERQTFEPFLQKTLLPAFADQLTSLKLYFGECWGTAPGYFDGSGLSFPNLKTLTLGNFVISHDNHFDWALSQPTLESLRLDCCFIASHIYIDDNDTETWNTPTHDWVQQPPGAFGFDTQDSAVFTYAGRWEAVYDNIRTRLPNLRDFAICQTEYRDVCFDDPGRMVNEGVSPHRYICLHTGILPTPWIRFEDFVEMDEDGGEPGEGNPSVAAEEGDRRAFQELMQAVKSRG